MTTKSARLVDTFVSVLFFVALAACGDIGSGCGCNIQPLPGGALPADQTIEGGGQVRVTQAGFQKLTSIVPGFLNDTLEEGFCVGEGSVGGWALGADYCYDNQTAQPGIPDSCGASRGCNVGINVDSTNISVTSSQRLNLAVQLDVHTRVPLDGTVLGIGIGSCNMHVDGNNLFVDADIAFSIDPATGELVMTLDQVNTFDSTGLALSNCGIISDLGNLINDILNSFIGEFAIELLTPVLNDLVQGFLPDPLGIEGLADVGGLVGGVSPGTSATMEARMVPGGYVQLRGNGMSLGLITGLNADEDITTRTPDLDSEPHYCVPPIPAPDFAAAPASLPSTSRGTFTLAPADEFLGLPEPADDLAIGLSETTLDLAGHHAVTSGAMCLGVGTNLIAQLNLGTFSLLVPSLGTLGEPENPVLLVTRPQKALDFTVGEGTDDSPAISIGIHDFEVDVYVFVYERYTRAFSMRLDLTVGVNLTFNQTSPEEPATVTPELVGLDADNIEVAVLNNEFVAESQDELEGVLPTIFDLAVGLLGDGLGDIEVPSFAGFTLNNLRVQHVTTSEDDFLAIYASLGTSQALRDLAETYPGIRGALADIDAMAPAAAPVTERPAIKLVAVDTPPPWMVRQALAPQHNLPPGKLPSVTLEVPATDSLGRPLEHAWSIQGGLWRPFEEGAELVISDRAFAWQGKYTLQIKSRVVGDYRTTSEVVQVPVIIDSVGPRVLVDRLTYADGVLTVPADDLVSPTSALRWAWGRPGDEQPWTDWSDAPTIDVDTVTDLEAGGRIQVWVKDEVGNVSTEVAVLPFHGQAGEGGCSCDTSGGGPSTGSLVLVLLGAALLFRRRLAIVPRRYWQAGAMWTGMVVLSSMVPGCSCGGDPGEMYCEVTEDCMLDCEDDEIPFCLNGVCTCLEDIPYGRIGPYSDVALASNGDAWISAYAETFGDLTVARWESSGRVDDEAWEWVDGVPDGPVDFPESDVRFGISEEGPDVGMYTSIAVGPNDVPMVTYLDRDNGSLKFATLDGAEWVTHTIDEGTGEIDEKLGGEIAGFYSSLTVRTDDGRPGVAYMAHVSEGGGATRAEVRFAASQTPNPTSASDWVFFVIEAQVLPATEEPDPTPIPGGVGLFCDATRGPDQAPSVAYYDRINGDLKLARLDPVGGTFGTPVVLAGGDGTDVGWYPSIAVDAGNVAHVSYLNATRDDLSYVNSSDTTPILVDDGYRIVGTTEDGLPKPEFHFVGDDSNIIIGPVGPVVVYQDATTHELLYSARTSAGIWERHAVAGDEAEFVGAYGFFASAVSDGEDVVISNWVIDQPHADNWVEIHRETLTVE